jgi:hypothetical protein
MHQSAMAFIDLNRITMPYKAMGYPCHGITMRWEDRAVGLPCAMLDRVHPLAQRWAAVMPFTGAQAQAHATRLVRCQPAGKADGRRSRACAARARRVLRPDLSGYASSERWPSARGPTSCRPRITATICCTRRSAALGRMNAAHVTAAVDAIRSPLPLPRPSPIRRRTLDGERRPDC